MIEATEMSIAQFAKEYGVSVRTVWRIFAHPGARGDVIGQGRLRLPDALLSAITLGPVKLARKVRRGLRRRARDRIVEALEVAVDWVFREAAPEDRDWAVARCQRARRLLAPPGLDCHHRRRRAAFDAAYSSVDSVHYVLASRLGARSRRRDGLAAGWLQLVVDRFWLADFVEQMIVAAEARRADHARAELLRATVERRLEHWTSLAAGAPGRAAALAAIRSDFRDLAKAAERAVADPPAVPLRGALAGPPRLSARMP